VGEGSEKGDSSKSEIKAGQTGNRPKTEPPDNGQREEETAASLAEEKQESVA